MKPCLFLLPLGLAISWIASAQTTSIAIFNPSFNLDTASCLGYYCAQIGVSGWIVGPQTYIQGMTTAQYKNAPPGGVYTAALGNTASTGSIFQTLGTGVQANTTYVLTLTVGARLDYPFTGYVGVLMAGNVTLASSNRATPVGGTFVDDVIVYNSGPNPPQLGQPLQILVKSFGTGQVDVLHASLTATVD